MNMIKFEEVENKVIVIRNTQVILDCDVAELYGVNTKEVNQAVKNNPDKFPEGYIFELTKLEKQKVVKNIDHLDKLKYSPQLPKCFTEKGLYMLATILKSKKAVETTIAIIETFSKIRQLSKAIKDLSKIKEEEEKKPLMKKSGELIAEILDDDLSNSETETTIELNFAVLKFKHTLKKSKRNKL